MRVVFSSVLDLCGVLCVCVSVCVCVCVCVRSRRRTVRYRGMCV